MIIKSKPTTLNTNNNRGGDVKIWLKQILIILFVTLLTVNLLVVLADWVLTWIGNM
jgi:hypothetical protein